MAIKPVTTPVSAYANPLFCQSIRHAKRTKVPCGCKCDWHWAQLACYKTERCSGRRRAGTRSVSSERMQPLDAFTLHPTVIWMPSQNSKSRASWISGGVNTLNYVSLSPLQRVSGSQSKRTNPVADKLANTCLAHVKHLPCQPPPQPSNSSLHHMVLPRSSRLLTTCASAEHALAAGLIVHWYAACLLVGVSHLYRHSALKQDGGSAADGSVWGGEVTDHDLYTQFIFTTQVQRLSVVIHPVYSELQMHHEIAGYCWSVMQGSVWD